MATFVTATGNSLHTAKNLVSIRPETSAQSNADAGLLHRKIGLFASLVPESGDGIPSGVNDWQSLTARISCAHKRANFCLICSRTLGSVARSSDLRAANFSDRCSPPERLRRYLPRHAPLQECL